MGKQVIVSEAVQAWKHLNGLFSVYKPINFSVENVKAAIITNVCRSLNELTPRPISKFVEIDGDPDDLGVIVRDNYADHPLVVGPRYQPQDVRLSWATKLGKRTSGVLVMGINRGTILSNSFNTARLLRTFRVKGRLGQVTDNMFADGKVLEKAKYDHVRRHHLERVLATFEASHQKQLFMQNGVDIQSQTAYELAVKGVFRTSSREVPSIYSFKSLEFESPDFTIEIMGINVDESYIVSIIHDIGCRLRTVAMCTGIQCVKHGCFTTEHSLLRRYWTTEHIINGIRQHERIMDENNLKLSHQPYLIEESRKITSNA